MEKLTFLVVNSEVGCIYDKLYSLELVKTGNEILWMERRVVQAQKLVRPALINNKVVEPNLFILQVKEFMQNFGIGD